MTQPDRSRLARAALAGLCMLLSGTPAIADDVPTRKAGLWEMTMSDGKEQPVKTRQCIDEKTDRELQRIGQSMPGANCSKNSFRKDGSQYIGESVCKMMSSTITSRSVTTGDFNSKYRTEVESRYDPPFMGMHGDKTVIESRYVGACPAGWKPGDMEVPGGRRVNLNQMMGGARGAAGK